MSEVFVCDAVRSPIGRFGGALSGVRADDLAAHPIKALKHGNPDLDWSAVDEVILGDDDSFDETDEQMRARIEAEERARFDDEEEAPTLPPGGKKL